MKRFTETEKWRDAWFRGLSLDAKLVFWYLTENCDHAGVWEPDYELVNFTFKRDIPWDEIKFELCGSVNGKAPRLRVLDNGKWFLTRFVFFQYGRLKPECIPHRSILKTIEKHGLTSQDVYPLATLVEGYEFEGLPKGSQRDKDKDKDKDKERGGAGGGRNPMIDALASVDGSDPRQIPPRSWPAIGECLSQIKEACPGVSAAEILRRRDNYRLHFPEIGPPSPHALTKHWARCDRPPINGNHGKGPANVSAEPDNRRYT